MLRLALFVGAAILCVPLAARALPPTADRFAPPLPPRVDGSGVIAEGLRSAAPGEIVTLAGDFAAADVNFEVFGQTSDDDAYRASVKPARLDARTAAIVLPDALPASSMYLVWPKTKAGFGKPFAINRTEAWWVGPDKVGPGERFGVFGRNLTLGDSRPTAFLASADGSGRALPILSGNPYRLELEAPALPSGAYDLWVHNGGGGQFGWSGPLRIELRQSAPIATPPVFDVRRFGATGDGLKDDGPAIEAALAAAAQAHPSVVYFPPGVYASARAFTAPSGVQWLGAGVRESIVRLTAPLDRLERPGFVHTLGDAWDLSFKRLSIEADGMVTGTDQALLALSGSAVHFSDFRLSSWGGMTLRLSATDVVVESGEIVGSGSFLASSSQVFVSGVTFAMTTDGEAALTSWGGRDIAITDTVLQNADESRPDGSGIGRLFVAQPHFGTVRNVYFSGDETRNSAPRDCAAVDCNKGEQIIFEFGSVTLQDAPIAVGPASVTFKDAATSELAGGLEVVVAGGPGLGQRRRIVASSQGRLSLDKPWDVMPDPALSRFFVTPVAERIAVYRNTFEGRATHSQHDSNSTAVLAWGLCFDVVVAHNEISRMRHGVMVAATSGTPRDSISSPYFTLVENNRIRDGYDGIYTGLTFGYDTDPDVSGGVGNVFRRNEIESMSRAGAAIDTWDTAGGSITATTFERNRMRDVRYGVVSGLKLIWSGRALDPTPARGTRLRQTILHRNDVEITPGAAGALRFRSDAFQDWLDLGASAIRRPILGPQ